MRLRVLGRHVGMGAMGLGTAPMPLLVEALTGGALESLARGFSVGS